MLEVIGGFPEHVVAITAKGRVTRQDYENVLIPAVNDVLKRRGKIRLYYEFGPQYSGFDADAALQDVKLGMEHWKDWERVAVVTDVEWIKQATLAFGFLLPGRMRVFTLAEAAEARQWVAILADTKKEAAARLASSLPITAREAVLRMRDTTGADFHTDLVIPRAEVVLRKGCPASNRLLFGFFGRTIAKLRPGRPATRGSADSTVFSLR